MLTGSVAVSAAGMELQPEGWNSFIACADGTVVYDDELATAVRRGLSDRPFGGLVFVFTQCFGGGMLDDLLRELDGLGDVAVLSASSHEESAWYAAIDTSIGCLKACGMKEPLSYYVEALASALESARGGRLTLAEMAIHAELHDAAAEGGAATRPTLCGGEDRVTEPEDPQAAFLGNGASIRLGMDGTGSPLSADAVHALLFVGEAYESWAPRDLERMYDALLSFGIPAEQMTVLAGAGEASGISEEGLAALAWPAYVERSATRDGLFSALEETLRALQPGDQLLFWTTGHGDRERQPPWSEALPLHAGVPATGALTSEDLLLSDDTRYDLYRFEGEAGDRIHIVMTSAAFDTYLYLYDSQRQVVDRDDDSGGGTDAVLELELPETGAYYVLANAFDPDEGGAYRLELWRGVPIAWQNAIPLDVGGPRDGKLEPEDPVLEDGAHYDLYAVELEADDPVRIELVSTAIDAFLWVYDPERRLVATSDDAVGSDAGVLLRPASSGRFTVAASSFAAAETGAYELRVLRGPDPGWAIPIAVGATASGELAWDDRVWFDGTRFDLYRIPIADEGSVTVTLTSEAFDAYLYALDSGLEPWLEDDDSAGDGNARLTISGRAGEALYLVVSSYDVHGYGAYALSIEPGDGGSAAIPWEEAHPIEIPARIDAALAASDLRWEDGTYYDLYAFEGQRGERVDLRLVSEVFDAYLMVYGPGGALLDSDDDSGGGTDAWCLLDLPEAGQYFVIANALYEGEQGEYLLTLETVP
jgi:hypothetical protein